ncbi:hypothetical protein [Streptacidiphilus fuscans]|uniref:Uncharacterized protein n=1 Tax=Streptacidiphilus fuscans TaxID=2789292 RepID=A0A931BBI9_9ACTN|nr:hypothetical protein [Streptacidiphilus fuscans]MBF9073541.1 hypothetical protein [Streptacidiphilus fuscans]
MPEYVVEVDTESVARARRATIRALNISAWTGVVGGGIICAIPFAAGITLGWRNSSALLLFLLPGLILASSSSRQFTAARRLRRTWAADGIPPVAMRISATGLSCTFSTAPLFLPWPALAGLRVNHQARGGPVIVLDLADGVTAATPGVVGLDHPDIQRALRSKVLGMRGLWLSVRTLRRPLPEIDAALAHFTNGRVRIH